MVLTGVFEGRGFISGFVAAGVMLVSNITHAFINTEIVGPNKRGGCCVVMLLALSLGSECDRGANVPIKT